MKLYGFGATRAGCYQFSTLNAEDDWALTRDSVSAPVGGRRGVVDYYFEDNYPLKPLTASKTFTVMPSLATFTGTGNAAIAIDDEAIDGSGTLFVDELNVGGTITIDGHAFTVASIESQTRAYATVASSWELTSQSFTVTPTTYKYFRLEVTLYALRLATIGQDESKLWAQMRDGSYRWCWAKCVSLATPEKQDTRLDIPVTLEFFCREGLWYSETLHTQTVTSAGDVNLTNVGNYPAVLSCDLTAGNAAVTAFRLTSDDQEWSFSGTLASTKHLIVSPGAYAATNDGANAYASLTFKDKAALWMYLSPNCTPTAIGHTRTGGGTGWTFTLSWYDTWIM